MRHAPWLLVLLLACATSEGSPQATTDGGATVAHDAADAPGDAGSGSDASADVTAEPAPQVEDLRQVVPSAGLPPEVAPDNANNNLDIVRHEGRLYLAFRTAPTHFASPDVKLHVVSTTDEQSWRWEGTFARGTDLREPRFLSWKGELRLTFAVLGASVLDFEPQGAMVTRLIAPGQWTEPTWFADDTFIPWRTKVIKGTPHMIGYTGGGNIYDEGAEPISIHWLTTEDGDTWTPMVPNQPVVQTGGGSETDLEILDDGTVIAVTRNEAGDETGYGSKICRAEPNSPGDWKCVHDPRKFDSPLVFRQGPDVWLIARRNVSETGAYDLGLDDLPPQKRHQEYQLAYWKLPKRCALWRVDPVSLTVDHVLDLPSRGDTCFPGLVRESDSRVLVYNYSSPVDGDDLSWVDGQFGPTMIYRQIIDF